MPLDAALIRRAAHAVREADALLITAGAGMGVDSGLPDFRGREGFWKAYPPLARQNIAFEQIARPRLFFSDPPLAWGFYAHRLRLYRQTVPHAGFALLRRWADGKPYGGFVFTSNVDGQFQRAGFEENALVECHGSLHYLQCLAGCHEAVWEIQADEIPGVDEQTLRAEPPLPTCPRCGGLARPNVLMFDDWNWMDQRFKAQQTRLAAWVERIAESEAQQRLVVLECGAGGTIPTVRWFSEEITEGLPGATLIRINPRDPHGGLPGTIGLATGALDALTQIQAALTA